MDFGNMGIFGLILLVIDIFAIYKILTSSAEMVKKIIWVLVVILLPLIGVILWWFMGPK
ncbi:MAG: hypothetical protein GKS01_01660 [Alphaproteobacteria bacterium]|nr:hypothetical protein [Alphaproteobacteria bacterium]